MCLSTSSLSYRAGLSVGSRDKPILRSAQLRNESGAAATRRVAKQARLKSRSSHRFCGLSPHKRIGRPRPFRTLLSEGARRCPVRRHAVCFRCPACLRLTLPLTDQTNIGKPPTGSVGGLPYILSAVFCSASLFICLFSNSRARCLPASSLSPPSLPFRIRVPSRKHGSK